MNGAAKITLYVILIVMACVSGFFASKNFKAMMDRSEDRVEIDPDEAKNNGSNSADPSADPSTNTPPADSSDTNAAPVGATVPTETATPDTNEVANLQTNALGTNSAAIKPKKTVHTAMGGTAEDDPSNSTGGIGKWTGIFLLSIISLGILLALDIAHLFGNRALKTLYNDEGEGIGNPAYELAEKEWSNGNHLEAIRMMRDYLNENPREQFVALRIAEIYEKDLNNPLAAALEYEEVLTKKLAPDRWGWAAIHLCNLYFKLNQEQKAFALLRRIVAEHPDVPAAEKARKRLEQIDGAAADETNATPANNPEAKLPARVVAAPQQPQSNLPPGFRPKK